MGGRTHAQRAGSSATGALARHAASRVAVTLPGEQVDRLAPMLTRFEIDSFKAFEHVDVELQPFTAIVGENGTGKTSVLQAIELLCSIVRESLGDVLGELRWRYADLPRLHAQTKEFGFTATGIFNGVNAEWALRFGKRRRPGVASERVTVDGHTILDRHGRVMERLDEQEEEWESVTQTLTSSWLSTVTKEDRERFPSLLAIANWARSIQPYMALAPVELREPSRRTDDGIGPSGQNLAGFLRYLKDKRDGRFDAVVRRVQQHYPQLSGISVRGGSYGWNRLEVVEDWDSGPVPFNSHQVSDGLLRVLAVSALFEQDNAPRLVMLDEVENGLHPHLLGGLVQLLQELAVERDVQVIVTSHSPIALNFIDDPAAVLIAHREDSGSVQLTPLDETKGYRGLGAELAHGELWYNLGERRLLG